MHQLQAYSDDVNLLGDNTGTTKKNASTLIYASKDVSLEINIEKTRYMLMSRHQNAGQNRMLSKNVKIRLYSTIIYNVVLYGCEIWSLTLR
jgi:hypothetical protein